MMIPAQLPELTALKHMDYLETAFAPSLTEDEAAMAMKGMIVESIRAWSRQIDDALHILAHS